MAILYFLIYMVLELMAMIRKEPSSNFCSISCYRWESLLTHGRRVVVVGDLNIAPSAIDRCDAEPDFDKNMFRTWLRSMLRECGGPFVDVFRSKHPRREGAYTCFSPRIGAEEFNYGSRIDHILIAGPCLHENHASEKQNLFDCHVEGSDIMIQFIRGNSVKRPKWLGGRSMKLEGSDHVPVYMILNGIPNLPEHSTPPLAVRYVPEVHGWQQTIVPFLRKRQLPDENGRSPLPDIQTGDNVASENVGEGSAKAKTHFSFDLNRANPQTLDRKLSKEGMERNSFLHEMKVPIKKVKCAAYSQLTLRSYFQKPNPNSDCDVERKNPDESLDLYDNGKNSGDISCGADLLSVKSSLPDAVDCNCGAEIHGNGLHPEDQAGAFSSCSSETEKRKIALLEWQQIQLKMKMSMPLCKGHSEPCVARSVKKDGPNIGRRFYICARAQGPAANPEANCGHFEWAGKRSRCRN